MSHSHGDVLTSSGGISYSEISDLSLAPASLLTLDPVLFALPSDLVVALVDLALLVGDSTSLSSPLSSPLVVGAGLAVRLPLPPVGVAVGVVVTVPPMRTILPWSSL